LAFLDYGAEIVQSV